MAHYVLVTGGREITEIDAGDAISDVLTFLKGFYGPKLRLMHGGARGIDQIAAKHAEILEIPAKSFLPDWKLGKRAGIERNERMCALLVDWEHQGHSVEVIAFPGGRGTAHCARFADQLGLNVTHIPLQGREQPVYEQPTLGI